MSTEKRVCRRSETAPVPVDLLLEIVALADVATVVRCAAADRSLRRAILDPAAFRRRLALAAEEHGFDPALLLGVSYWEHLHNYIGNARTHRVIHAPGAPTELRVRLDADNLRPDSFEPVASRDGLLVLRRHHARPERPYFKVDLRVCDSFTGRVTSLPLTTLFNAYFIVVLSVSDARRSFELLVADMTVRFHRTFSSKDGQWSAMNEVSVTRPSHLSDSNCSAVIGRTVYWPRRVNGICHSDHILALDVDSGEATMTELPPGCFARMMAAKKDENLLLAPVRGRLCVLVAESRGLAMWTLTSSASVAGAATWSRQVVVSSLEIARQAGLDPYKYTAAPFVPVGFGERSGAVILNWASPRESTFLRLDLGTKEEAPVVVTTLGRPGNAGRFTRLFLHEIDLASLLQAMKPF